MSKTVTITKTKMAKIHKLAKTMPNLTKIAALMKTAQDGGTLGPEEVKDIAEDTQQVLLSVVEMVEDIIQGVPVEEEITEDVTENVREEEPAEEKPMLESREDNNDDDNRERENLQIAKLQKEITQIKDASLHKDLTIKYGKLFPDTIREAKEKEFAASKDTIPILQARIKEASQIIKERKSMKVAQLEDGTTVFIEDDNDDNTNSALDYKGKF